MKKWIMIFVVIIVLAIAWQVYCDLTSPWDRIFSGHGSGRGSTVDTVHFCGNTEHIASGDLSGKILVWDYRTGRKITAINVQKSSKILDCSLDGRYLTVGNYRGYMEIWDLLRGVVIKKKPYAEFVAESISLDGKYIAVYGKHSINIFRSESPDKIIKSINCRDIDSLTFSPDGKLLISGGDEGYLESWEPFKGEKVKSIKAHITGIQAVKFSQDGTMLATGSSDVSDFKFGPIYKSTAMKLWSWPSMDLIRVFKYRTWVYSIDFSPDGKYMISNGEVLCGFRKGIATVKLDQFVRPTRK